ncbi:MAG: hypothetical protein DI565_19500 [Ancylobacter novellus]|uniref:Uncharacterized protein n=1 Tax=Ancylobacter novellus TaxID=921 RepID=A0A2W5K101_ANCNO|nr:MAG: hypothetical protein DI565_19500 [Ancylobacter novellus]
MRSLKPRAVSDLGPAWAGSSVNTSIYRQDGVATVDGLQVGAFYDEDGRPTFFKRDALNARVELRRLEEPSEPWDGHRSISLGIDADGRIHAAYGAHGDALRYVRGGKGLDLATIAPAELGPTDRPTYPMFVRHGPGNGELALFYRRGGASNGDIMLKRFDRSKERWRDGGRPLLEGTASSRPSGPYLNRLLTTADGAVHGFLAWRLKLAAGEERVVNSGLDLVAFVDDLRRVAAPSGFRFAPPIGAAQAERVVAVPFDGDLINQGGAELDPQGVPAAATWWRDPGEAAPQFRLVHRAADGFRAVKASAFTTPFTLAGRGTLVLPHSRPALLFSREGHAVLVYRSREIGGALAANVLAPPDYRFVGRTLLWDEDLGAYEPIVDHAAWREGGVLSVLLQRCAQPPRDGSGERTSAEARVVEWAEDEILARAE